MSKNTAKTNLITLKPSEVSGFLQGVLKAGKVPYIHGSPGLGKSDIIRSVAEYFNLKLIDFRLSQCDPTDISGFPVMENGRSTYAPNQSFPIEGDKLPVRKDGTTYDGWLLFFDELSSAPHAVQAASYKILLDRQVGDKNLHTNVMMAGAGNLETDNAIVNSMSTALQSRLIHAIMETNLRDWQVWAAGAGIDHRISAFLDFKPTSLYTFDPEHSDLTFACPRTWQFASELLKEFDIKTQAGLTRAVLAGTLGQGVAHEFSMFCDLFGQIPKISDIIANPAGIPVPAENGHRYALAGSIAAHIDKTNSKELFAYLGRMSVEFQITALRSAIRRDITIAQDPGILAWAVKNAHLLQ